MRKTYLRKISKKRQEQLKEYSKLRAAYLEEHTVCEVCEKANGTEIHHRSQGRGSKTNNVDLFVSICRKCHHEVHFGACIPIEQNDPTREESIANGIEFYGPKWSRFWGWLV